LFTITPVKEVPEQQPRIQEDHEMRNAISRDVLEDDEVNGQRHGRRDHRPHQAQHRVLVLDLDFGTHQVDQQLAAKPDLAQALPQADA